MTSAAAAIELEDVSLGFLSKTSKDDYLHVLDDVSLTVAQGEIVAVLGPSGCGKSTLLNLAAGLLRPASGSVRTLGELVSGPNQRVGYVTQGDTLLPWRTIAQNIAVPLQIKGASKEERAERIRSELERVNLQDFASFYPSQLSGGMRSRANLVRTLVYRPAILLMDEPFAALDALMRQRLQQELLDMWSESPQAILYITHDIDEAIVLAHRAVVMGRSPSRIKATFDIPYGSPRDVTAVRADQDFPALRTAIWHSLSSELETTTPQPRAEPASTRSV